MRCSLFVVRYVLSVVRGVLFVVFWLVAVCSLLFVERGVVVGGCCV